MCEHEIRNIHCACQDAEDLSHFAYITKDLETKGHYCHVFRVQTRVSVGDVVMTSSPQDKLWCHVGYDPVERDLHLPQVGCIDTTKCFFFSFFL